MPSIAKLQQQYVANLKDRAEKAEAERDELRLQLVVAKTDAEVSLDLLNVTTKRFKEKEAELAQAHKALEEINEIANKYEPFSTLVFKIRNMLRALITDTVRTEGEPQ